MEITLPPDLEDFIETQVECGAYSSAHEVILASVQLFAEMQAKTSIQNNMPKSSVGLRLRGIRRRAVEAGMTLVDAEVLATDLHQQRNRVSESL